MYIMAYKKCRSNKQYYSSGLGLETCRELLAHGATVYMLIRTPARAENVIKQLETDIHDIAGHVAVINAARDTEALILLPAAMFHIFRRGVRSIVERQDIELLNDVSKDAILAALPTLARLSRRYSFSVLYSDEQHISPECQSISRCHKTLKVRIYRP